MLLGRVGVEDDVTYISGRDLAHDDAMVTHELVVARVPHMEPDDPALGHLEGIEERRCALTLLVLAQYREIADIDAMRHGMRLRVLPDRTDVAGATKSSAG